MPIIAGGIIFGAISKAVRYFTIIGLPRGQTAPAHEWGLAGALIPLVGLAYGACALGVFSIATLMWPNSLSRVFVWLACLLAGQSTELDCIGDLGDGLAGKTTAREDTLRRMKDPRIGAGGAVAMLVSTILQISCLLTLREDRLLSTLWVAPVLGLWSNNVMLVRGRLAYEGSLLRDFVEGASVSYFLLSTVAASTIAILILGPVRGTGSVVLVASIAWLMRRITYARLGGAQGDALGAARVITRIAVFVVQTAV